MPHHSPRQYLPVESNKLEVKNNARYIERYGTCDIQAVVVWSVVGIRQSA